MPSATPRVSRASPESTRCTIRDAPTSALLNRKCSRRTNPTDRWAVRSGDFNTFDSDETLEECRAGTPGSIISGSDEKSKLPAAYVAPPFGDGDLERRVRFDIAAAWRHERSTHRVFVGRQVDRLRLEHRIVRASRWPSLRRQQHPGVQCPTQNWAPRDRYEMVRSPHRRQRLRQRR
jgi:hypothetical protein